MKLLITFALLLASQIAFSQNDDDEVLIQNFYETCKAANYSAYTAANTGIQLFDTKQYSRSLKNFEKALEKDPSYCDAWYLIAHCNQKTGDYQKAIEACNKSLEMNPTNPSALIIKANTLFLMKDTVSATDVFRKVKEMLPDKVDGYYGLALMLYLLEQIDEASKVLVEMEQKGVKTLDVRDNKKIKDLKNKTQQI